MRKPKPLTLAEYIVICAGAMLVASVWGYADAEHQNQVFCKIIVKC